jgi:surfeit locus 1 family protein
MSRSGLIAAAAASLVGVVLLTSLGIWQLKRLAWKEALIAQVEARAHAAPVDAPPPSGWGQLKPEDYEYRHVRISGVYDYTHQELIFRGLETPRGPYGGVGYFVATPLWLASGESVIVNRGFVPDTMKAEADKGPRGEVTVTGLMRASERRNLFTPADDATKGVFYTQDAEALAHAMRLAAHAPFVIEADAGTNPLPEGGETRLSFPNNHLSYAFTWFGLAVALAGVFGTYAWGQVRGKKADKIMTPRSGSKSRR